MKSHFSEEESFESFLETLNDGSPEELALPGNWSPQIFFKDVQTYPPQTTKILAENLFEAINQSEPSYLTFFEQTRGFPRPCQSETESAWKIFSQGSIMLYFESTFIRMIHQSSLTETDQVLLQYLNALSKKPFQKWDSILAQIGACNFKFFAQEPELYAFLIFRKKATKTSEMTDFEMLEAMSSNLSPSKYSGKISHQDSRSELISVYRNWKKKSKSGLN